MKTKKMVAFHGSIAIKNEYLGRVRAHRAADELVRGKYWEKGRGCAVGCTIHGSAHERYETELGIPKILAHLEDRIFESLPNEEAMSWPERFLDAISPGANLSRVWPHFAVWLLTDPQCGVLRHAKKTETRICIQRVSDLWARMAAGEDVANSEFAYAADAADAASGGCVVCGDYVVSAADAASAVSAADAVSAASAAYAAYAARKDAYIAQSEKLIELLKAQP